MKSLLSILGFCFLLASPAEAGITWTTVNHYDDSTFFGNANTSDTIGVTHPNVACSSGNVGAPAGTVIILAQTLINGAVDPGVSTGPAGYTKDFDTVSTTDQRLVVWHKIATGSETCASLTVSWTGGAGLSWWLGYGTWSGTPPGTPLDTAGSRGGIVASGTCVGGPTYTTGMFVNAVTLSVANDIVLGFYATGNLQSPYTLDTNETSVYLSTIGGGGNYAYFQIGNETVASASTISRCSNYTGTFGDALAGLVAFQPSSGSGPTAVPNGFKLLGVGH